MTSGLLNTATDIGQLDYAADCEREAWETSPGQASAELYEEAQHARLAAMALAVDA